MARAQSSKNVQRMFSRFVVVIGGSQPTPENKVGYVLDYLPYYGWQVQYITSEGTTLTPLGEGRYDTNSMYHALLFACRLLALKNGYPHQTGA